MYIILRAVDNLKTILAPVLPHTPVLCTGRRSCKSTWGTTGSPFDFASLGLTRDRQGRLFGTQLEYEEEARHGGLRSHRALTYDHSEATGTHSLRFLRFPQDRQCRPG